MDEGERLSRDVMLYTEKTAALYLKLNNKDAALNSLQNAYQIAITLNDTETVERLSGLMTDLSAANAAEKAAAEAGQVVTMDQVQIQQ